MKANFIVNLTKYELYTLVNIRSIPLPPLCLLNLNEYFLLNIASQIMDFWPYVQELVCQHVQFWNLHTNSASNNI